MASRSLTKISAITPGLVAVPGSFAPNGSSALVATAVKGKGFSVAYTSTGLYTITFQDVWPVMVACTATLQEATAGDQYVTVGTYVAASKTLVITAWDASDGAVADVAANANNRINFCAWFGNLSFS